MPGTAQEPAPDRAASARLQGAIITLRGEISDVTLTSIETVVGGTGDDAVTLGAAISGAAVSLGNGTDTLTLADGTNSLTVTGIETITGGTGADTVTVSNAMTAGSLVLGAGNDKLVDNAKITFILILILITNSLLL